LFVLIKGKMFEKVVVIDGRGPLLGRLASVLAKELLNGQKVVVVRCEEIQISGSLFRNQLIFSKFLQHRGNTNPKRGPFHYRSPSRILWRAIRGMMPHKKQRGQAALERLKVFEGTPFPYDHMKRVVVPFALRVLRLKPGRKYCRLGDLATSVGWAHDGLIKRLEEKRMKYSSAHYLRKKSLAVLKKKALGNVSDKLEKVSLSSAPSTHSSTSTSAPTQPKSAPKEKTEKKEEKKVEKKPAAEKKTEKTDAPAKEKRDAPAKEKKDKPAAEKKEKPAPEKKEKPAPAKKEKPAPKKKEKEEVDE